MEPSWGSAARLTLFRILGLGARGLGMMRVSFCCQVSVDSVAAQSSTQMPAAPRVNEQTDKCSNLLLARWEI